MTSKKEVALCAMLLQHAVFADHTANRTCDEVREALLFFFPEGVVKMASAIQDPRLISVAINGSLAERLAEMGLKNARFTRSRDYAIEFDPIELQSDSFNRKLVTAIDIGLGGLFDFDGFISDEGFMCGIALKPIADENPNHAAVSIAETGQIVLTKVLRQLIRSQLERVASDINFIYYTDDGKRDWYMQFTSIFCQNDADFFEQVDSAFMGFAEASEVTGTNNDDFSIYQISLKNVNSQVIEMLGYEVSCED